MSETWDQDVSDLWGIYQTLKAQYQAVIAEKVAWVGVLASLRAGIEPDVSSVASSGEGGSESYTEVTAQEHIDRLTVAEAEIFRTMRETRLMAIRATPGFERRHVGRGMIGRL